MPYVLIFHDDEGVADIRATLRPDHLAYMAKNAYRALASGGLLSDDGQEAFGGVIIIDTDTREDADAFVKQDPFWGKVYTSYTLTRWRKVYLDGKNYLPPNG